MNGGLPTSLLGVCVDAGGQRAAMLDAYPNQINAQAPAMTASTVSVRVLTNYGTGFGPTTPALATGQIPPSLPIQ